MTNVRSQRRLTINGSALSAVRSRSGLFRSRTASFFMVVPGVELWTAVTVGSPSVGVAAMVELLGRPVFSLSMRTRPIQLSLNRAKNFWFFSMPYLEPKQGSHASLPGM